MHHRHRGNTLLVQHLGDLRHAGHLGRQLHDHRDAHRSAHRTGDLTTQFRRLSNEKAQLSLGCLAVRIAKIQLNSREAQLLHLAGIADPVFHIAGSDAANDHHAVFFSDGQQLRCFPAESLHRQHGAAPGEKVILVRITLTPHRPLIHVSNVDARNSRILQGRCVGHGLGDDSPHAALGKGAKLLRRAGNVSGGHHNRILKVQA